jgi:tRNA uridine 5-carboxymethylaminomethyl modification enzyme
VARAKTMEEAGIPAEMDFGAIAGLRTEARQKLAAVAPRSLGQAARISGVTPADVALLAVWVRRGQRAHAV